MRSEIFDRVLKNIPLETRLKVAIEAYFVVKYGGSFFVPLDNDGQGNAEVIQRKRECLEKVQPVIDLVFEEIKQWKLDGKPE